MIESDPRSSALDREKLRFAITREWRVAGRWDFSEREIAAEIDARLADLHGRRAANRQLQLPLLDVGQVAAATKRAACKSTRQLRISVRDQIVSLLEQAGADGLTREELATALDAKEGSVSAPVRYLLDRGQACEPTSRVSSTGRRVAVVVLCNCISGATAGVQS